MIETKHLDLLLPLFHSFGKALLQTDDISNSQLHFDESACLSPWRIFAEQYTSSPFYKPNAVDISLIGSSTNSSSTKNRFSTSATSNTYVPGVDIAGVLP